MFENFIENEDELAVVLGHEVAHLILGHVSQRNALERMLRTLEVLLLSIDPTEGLVSLGVIGGLMWMRRVLMASFSRDHELEADELGLKIAAMACYNTKRGSYVMKKMHDEAIKLAGEPTHYSNLLTMLDTHPPSLDRYNKLVEQCQYEHSGLYPDRCAQIHERLLRAVWK
jgi:Zn-dependent protease with chaperone function